jgi:hypothetical protein
MGFNSYKGYGSFQLVRIFQCLSRSVSIPIKDMVDLVFAIKSARDLKKLGFNSYKGYGRLQ